MKPIQLISPVDGSIYAERMPLTLDAAKAAADAQKAAEDAQRAAEEAARQQQQREQQRIRRRSPRYPLPVQKPRAGTFPSELR